MNTLDIIVYDFETGGLKAGWHEAIQIAGKAYNGRTLEPYPEGEFCSLMKPEHPERLDDGALKVNGKTREELAKAPDQKAAWLSFVEWVNRFNLKRNTFGAPIAAGYNIRNFDSAFVNVLNKKHGPKKDKTLLFNTYRDYDLKDDLFRWFRWNEELVNEKLDTVRAYFGLSLEGAHDALVDVRQTGELMVRFLSLYRTLGMRPGKDGQGKFIKFKNCCARTPAA